MRDLYENQMEIKKLRRRRRERIRMRRRRRKKSNSYNTDRQTARHGVSAV